MFLLNFYLCPDNDIVNKSKIGLFKAFCAILGWSLWILKYIKMHIFAIAFILYFLKLSAGKGYLHYVDIMLDFIIFFPLCVFASNAVPMDQPENSSNSDDALV